MLSIQYNGVKVLDAYCFMPIALAKFPAAYDLTELRKGFFAYDANNPDNFNKIFDCHPSPESFGTKFFSKKKIDEFNIWYDQNKHKPYNLRQEMEEYCLSDTVLLLNGVLKFEKILYEATKLNNVGIHCYDECITIASLSHMIFKRNCLKPKTLAYIPEHQFSATKRFSAKSIIWLEWEMKKRNIKIDHAVNSCEKKIAGKYYVDGYCEEKKIIFEFVGLVFGYFF